MTDDDSADDPIRSCDSVSRSVVDAMTEREDDTEKPTNNPHGHY